MHYIQSYPNFLLKTFTFSVFFYACSFPNFQLFLDNLKSSLTYHTKNISNKLPHFLPEFLSDLRQFWLVKRDFSVLHHFIVSLLSYLYQHIFKQLSFHFTLIRNNILSCLVLENIVSCTISPPKILYNFWAKKKI